MTHVAMADPAASDEEVVLLGAATISIDFEVLKVKKCDGTNDHYFWRLPGASESDDSECWPTWEMAERDAETTLEYRARNA